MNDAAPYIVEKFKPGNKRPAHDGKPTRFALVPFDQIEISAGASYLVKGLIPRAGLVVVWGPPKCGKSFLTFDLSMHVALGWEYRGRRVKQGCVVYCALEGAQGFRARVEAFRREKLSGETSSPPFHLMASALNLVADQAAFLEALRAQLGEEKPVAVVIDTLNRSLAGSESDDKDMAAYVRAADAIRDAFDCAVVIVHHCGHNGERPRGHSSLIGAVDAQIAVKRDAAENIVATLELSKDGEAGAEIVSRLVPVEVGRDEDDEPIRSCVIVAVDALASAKATKQPRASNCRRRRKLRFARSTRGSRNAARRRPPSNHIPDGIKAITMDQWRDYSFADGDKRLRRNSSQANRPQSRIRGAARCPEDFNLGTLRLDDVTSRHRHKGHKHTPFRGGVVFCVLSFDTDRHFVAFCVLLYRRPSLRGRTRPTPRAGVGSEEGGKRRDDGARRHCASCAPRPSAYRVEVRFPWRTLLSISFGSRH